MAIRDFFRHIGSGLTGGRGGAPSNGPVNFQGQRQNNTAYTPPTNSFTPATVNRTPASTPIYRNPTLAPGVSIGATSHSPSTPVHTTGVDHTPTTVNPSDPAPTKSSTPAVLPSLIPQGASVLDALKQAFYPAQGAITPSNVAGIAANAQAVTAYDSIVAQNYYVTQAASAQKWQDSGGTIEWGSLAPETVALLNGIGIHG